MLPRYVGGVACSSDDRGADAVILHGIFKQMNNGGSAVGLVVRSVSSV